MIGQRESVTLEMRSSFRPVRLQIRLVLVATTALMAAGVTTSALAAGAAATARPAIRFDSHRTATVLLKRFAILRTAHKASVDTIPEFADAMLNRAGPVIGLNTSGVVEVQPTPSVTMWFVPGESGSCIVALATGPGSGGGGGASCGVLTAGRLGPAIISETSYEGTSDSVMLGFASNGNSSVSAVTSAGVTVRASVKQNAYVLQPPPGTSITSVSGIDIGGAPTTLTVSAPAPAPQ